MTWAARELDDLLAGDVEDVVERAQSVAGRERSAALRDVLWRLEIEGEILPRLKLLLFIQGSLATVDDGKLAASIAERAAQELSRVVISAVEPIQLTITPFDPFALLFLKARELRTDADRRVRSAFRVACEFTNPQLSSFARSALAAGGVLSRRRVQTLYRRVNVTFAVAAAGAGAAHEFTSDEARVAGRKGLVFTKTSNRAPRDHVQPSKKRKKKRANGEDIRPRAGRDAIR